MNNTRFTHTVTNYLLARPTYPKKIIEILQQNCGLTSQSIIADIGSGTGLFAELFLANGNQVFAVEPDDAMSKAAVKQLGHDNHFKGIHGSAEATTLPAKSVDFVTAATAFHWFDFEKSKQEFLRILKPNGWLVLIWNVRASESSSLMMAYEQLITHYGKDYLNVAARHNVNDDLLKAYFAPATMHTFCFSHYQTLNLENFIARIFSTSYAPKSNESNYEIMLKEAQSIFERFQKNGTVEFLYDCKGYFAKIT